MNAKILNRNFEHPTDGWYQIEPKGDHPNRASGIVQVIDDDAINSIVNRFNAEADKPEFPGMLIDHEHFKHDAEKETRAYGWLMRLQNRADGVYGQIKWTNTGKEAVDGGDYRFFSTEYDPSDLKVLNSAKPRRMRPLRLDGLTLTNNPNNRGGKPITNRNEKFTGESDDSTDNTKNQRTTMKSVATKLGLSADASEEAVLAEVTKIINRAETAEAQLTPIKNRSTELEKENQTLLADQVEALLDGHNVKEEKIRNRMKGVLAGLKNREERVAALTDFGFKPTAAKAASNIRVLNRGEGKQPETETEDATDEKAVADKILNRANQLKGENGSRSFEECWNQARTEAAKK